MVWRCARRSSALSERQWMACKRAIGEREAARASPLWRVRREWMVRVSSARGPAAKGITSSVSLSSKQAINCNLQAAPICAGAIIARRGPGTVSGPQLARFRRLQRPHARSRPAQCGRRFFYRYSAASCYRGAPLRPRVGVFHALQTLPVSSQ